MRLTRIASVITTIGCISASVAMAQDTNIDDLLSELNFAPAATETTPVVAEETAVEPAAEANAEVAAEPMIDDTLFSEEVTAGAAEATSEAVVSEEVVTEVVEFAEGAPASADEAAPVEAEKLPTITEEPDADAIAAAKLMAEQEEVRRQEKQIKGDKLYAEGKSALAEGKFEDAARKLSEARSNLPPKPENAATIEDIRVSLGTAYTEIAAEALDKDITFARKSVDQALAATPENRRAQSIEKRVAAKERKLAEAVARPKLVTAQPKYGEKYKSIEELLREGRDLFNAQEYNDAELAFDRVLQLDEYNVEAMRYLRKIDETRFDIRTREREATVAEMMSMVRDTWNPPIRTDSKLPQGLGAETQIDTVTAQQRLQKKMENIIIPSIEFRQANITDVVNFLVDASVAGDTNGVGVNIILKLAMPGADAAPAPAVSAPADDFGFGADFGASTQPAVQSTPGAANVPAITLNLRRINLLDATKYITEVADLRYRLEDNVVIITPANVVSGRVITRMYPVQPSILDVIVETQEDETQTETGRQGDFIELGAGTTTIKRSDVKQFFERAGVPFPVGTSITYNQSISQLIVANTAENLENFERILSRLNVIPNQVEIEARFVEVNQDDLEELGFQWFLTDNWEIAQRNSGVSPAATESIIMRSDTDGFTKGNRFFARSSSSGAIQPTSTTLLGADQTALGGIATFASVLTNPELTLVVNALKQKGGTDLLSAPRVTTRSGVNAQIQVVQEIIYPTDFTSESVGGDIGIFTDNSSLVPGTGAGTVENNVTSIIVYPDTFSTREIGVLLNVTPTVGPDGYTIDLTLVPEVSELVDWIQYGQAPFNIPQPIFGSRKVTTSIVVWDGQTVVLGGLIREDLVKYEDKIPVLGDIPILGRLFTSKGELSKKKNLLIFVTARLVGPDGKPIQRDEVVTETAEAQATP